MTNKLEEVRRWILILTVTMSILSQLPLLRITARIDTQLLIYPFWGILIVLTILKNEVLSEKFIITTIIPYLIFIFTALLYEILLGNKYFTSALSFQIYASLVIVWIGYSNIDIIKKYYSSIVKIVICSSFLLTLDIYLEYFLNYSFEEITYVFRSKNSAAFILMIALIMMYSNYEKQNILVKISRVFIAVVYIYLCLLMRSRAVIISIMIFIIFWISTSEIKKVFKWMGLVTLLCMAIVVINTQELNQLLIQNILLNGQELSDLNQISSNRLQYFSDFKTLASEGLFGVGERYIDNFYLESILNYGWPLGLFAILLAILPIRMVFGRQKNKSVVRFLTILVVVYLINAFFEGFAPFGPGAKCFTLWLFYGAWQKYNEI